MSKIKVKQLANNSFAVEGGKADGWVGAGTYMATANNNGYVVILNRDGKDSLFAAHYKDIEIYDEEGTKVTCNSVGDVVAGLNAFVGNFRRSAAETDPSSQALWYDEASKTLVQNVAIPTEHFIYKGKEDNIDGTFYKYLVNQSIDMPFVKSVGDEAFFQYSSLQSIDIPLAESIGVRAFRECTSLQSINVPLVESVGGSAFNRCSSLQSIDLPLATSLEDYVFSGCSALQSVTVPLAKSLGGSAFYECTSLQSIDLPLATSLENYTFYGCTKLQSINVPLVESVGQTVFRGCTSLQSIDLPLAKSLGLYAFNLCSSLQSINLGNPNDDLLISGSLADTQLNKLTDINFNAKAITLGGNINLSLSPNLKKSCIMQLFEKLVDNTGSTAKTITVSSANTFTEEELAIATDKNYTVSIK